MMLCVALVVHASCTGNPYTYCRAQPKCHILCPPMPYPFQNATCKCDHMGHHCACYTGRFPLCVAGLWECN
jgi:hypothetical protein